MSFELALTAYQNFVQNWENNRADFIDQIITANQRKERDREALVNFYSYLETINMTPKEFWLTKWGQNA